MNSDNGKIVCDDDILRFIVRQRYSQNHEVIDVSDLDVSKCSNIVSLFLNMCDLKEIKGLNTWDTKNITDMSGMFMGCHSLISIDLSGLNLSNVKHVNSMCSGCYSLMYVNLQGVDLSNCVDNNPMMSKNNKSLIRIIPPSKYPTSTHATNIFNEEFVNEINERGKKLEPSIIHNQQVKPKPTNPRLSIEDYEQQNEIDIDKIKRLEAEIAKLKNIVNKRTYLIQALEEYESLM